MALLSLTARLTAAGLLAAGLALPAAAETFDFTIAGIKVGTLVMDGTETGGTYKASSRIDSAGVLGVFADFFFHGQATGTVKADGTVVPSRFSADSKSPRALRRTVIESRDGTPVEVSVEPPRQNQPDPSTQAGSLDPVSAGFRLFRPQPAAAVCGTTIKIFDGSRESRLKVAAPVAAGDAVTCDGTYSRVSGEAHSMADKREFPFRLVFRKDAAGLAQLQRIEAPTNYGSAVIARR